MAASYGDRNFRDSFWSGGALAPDGTAGNVCTRLAGCDRTAAAEIAAALSTGPVERKPIDEQSGMAAGSGRFANLDGIVAVLENNSWSARRTVFAFQVRVALLGTRGLQA